MKQEMMTGIIIGMCLAVGILAILIKINEYNRSHETRDIARKIKLSVETEKLDHEVMNSLNHIIKRDMKTISDFTRSVGTLYRELNWKEKSAYYFIVSESMNDFLKWHVVDHKDDTDIQDNE